VSNPKSLIERALLLSTWLDEQSPALTRHANRIFSWTLLLDSRNEIFEEYIPQRLYHYTSVESLFHMVDVEFESIPTCRFSSASTLNDIGELNFGHGILLSALSKRILFKPYIEAITNMQELVDSLGVFSMSAHHDEIPLWQSYGDHGKGVSIGLETERLMSTCRLFRVVYGEDEGIRYVDRVLNRVEKWVKEVKIQTEVADPGQFLKSLLAVVCLTVKHKKWQYESEWRMIFTHANEVALIRGNPRRIATLPIRGILHGDNTDMNYEFHREMEDNMKTNNPYPLREVIFSAANSEAVMKTFKHMLESKDCIGIEYRNSECPFRF
jgi:hypothetical protein